MRYEKKDEVGSEVPVAVHRGQCGAIIRFLPCCSKVEGGGRRRGRKNPSHHRTEWIAQLNGAGTGGNGCHAEGGVCAVDLITEIDMGVKWHFIDHFEVTSLPLSPSLGDQSSGSVPVEMKHQHPAQGHSSREKFSKDWDPGKGMGGGGFKRFLLYPLVPHLLLPDASPHWKCVQAVLNGEETGQLSSIEQRCGGCFNIWTLAHMHRRGWGVAASCRWLLLVTYFCWIGQINGLASRHCKVFSVGLLLSKS